MIKNITIYCLGCLALNSFFAHAMEVTIQNKLSSAAPCPNGNTVNVFFGYNQKTIPINGSITLDLDATNGVNLGLQVNNWYWTPDQNPVGTNPQNPDNSGAQFTFNEQCGEFKASKPWSGDGIRTDLIANVTIAKNANGGCTITIKNKDPYTNAVTPGCCAPPISTFTNVCAGSWGKTDNNQPWPPASAKSLKKKK